jgi:hypothetical protein
MAVTVQSASMPIPRPRRRGIICLSALILPLGPITSTHVFPAGSSGAIGTRIYVTQHGLEMRRPLLSPSEKRPLYHGMRQAIEANFKGFIAIGKRGKHGPITAIQIKSDRR